MFNSYLKITLRNFYREKMYTMINISGLSIAIACCIILGLWLRSELTYDRYNTMYKQIFRVAHEIIGEADTRVPMKMGPILSEEYPEVKDCVRFSLYYGNSEIRHGDTAFTWTSGSIYSADGNVFDIFTHEVIYGDPQTALVDPSSAAVSETFSRKYFGSVNPIGENIILGNNTFKITLVFADLPENSSLQYDVLLKLQVVESDRNADYTYLLMTPDYNVRDFDNIAASFYDHHVTKLPGPALSERFWLQPLADIHFDSTVPGLKTGDKFCVYGFLAVAIFILTVACINYMNLTTARSTKRSKEIGIRKIVGSSRSWLIFHFMGESIFLSIVSMFLAFVLVELILHLTPINELLDKPLALNIWHEPVLLLWMLLLSLGVGLFSGAYPAIYLSSIPVLSALMGGHRGGKSSVRFQQFLVLIQFTITVCVISCTLLMALQMRYVSKKPLGFEKENIVFTKLKGEALVNKLPAIKNELSKNSSILEITTASNMLGMTFSNTAFREWQSDTGMIELDTATLTVDDNYLEVMGMQLSSGKDFSKKMLTGMNSYIVNEALVKKMGWKAPLNKNVLGGRIIGVVKDFHFDSFHSPITSMLLSRYGNTRGPGNLAFSPNCYLVMKISNENISQTIKFLEEKLSEFDSKNAFEYSFLDETLDKLYLSDQRLMKLIGLFGGVCIFISCMGLFGLSAFTTERRTKEIGIRKVLGASTRRIILMLFQSTLYLVLGGAIVASLCAYYVMDEWLRSFSYRTGIDPWVFLLSAVVAAVIAFITVALQSFKTVRANPVDALRYE